MGLSRPPFDPTEYSCLRRDLSGPSAMVNWESKEAKTEELRKQLQGLKSQPLFGGALRAAIEDRILSRKVTQNLPPIRQQMLKTICPEIQRLLYKDSKYKGLVAVQLEQAINHVLYTYFAFDVESFREDFSAAFGSQESRELERQIERTQRALDEMLVAEPPSWTRFLNYVPDTWRTYSMQSASMTRLKMAETILRNFVKDYRSRAAGFSVPVSISGIAIATMPASRQATWQKLYDKMGLDDIPKRPKFQYLVFDGEVEADEQEERLPLVFRKRQETMSS